MIKLNKKIDFNISIENKLITFSWLDHIGCITVFKKAIDDQFSHKADYWNPLFKKINKAYSETKATPAIIKWRTKMMKQKAN